MLHSHLVSSWTIVLSVMTITPGLSQYCSWPFSQKGNKTFCKSCISSRLPPTLSQKSKPLALFSRAEGPYLLIIWALFWPQSRAGPPGLSAWLAILLIKPWVLGSAGQLPSHSLSHLGSLWVCQQESLLNGSVTQSPAQGQLLRISKQEIQRQSHSQMWGKCSAGPDLPAFVCKLMRHLNKNFLPSGFSVSVIKKIGLIGSRILVLPLADRLLYPNCIIWFSLFPSQWNGSNDVLCSDDLMRQWASYPQHNS